MTRKTILAILAVLALGVAPALAQRTGVTITTFAALPPTCTDGQPFVVIDANATCTAGSGAKRWCICESDAYIPDPAGAPGVDSVGTAELDDGADTPLAGEWVQVDPGDTGRFNYRTDAELLTDSGAAPLASPALTGDPTAPTPSVNDNDTSIATTAFVQAETFAGDVSGTIGATVVDDVQTATTNTEVTGDSTTQVASTAFVQQEIRLAEDWEPFDFFMDGTRCKPPVEATINSGAAIGTMDCDNHASSQFEGNRRLDDYGGGTIVFTLRAVNVNATPSGVMDWDFRASCRGDGDAMNDTWSANAAAAITFATQFAEEHVSTAAVTPDGSCAVGDTLYWQAILDEPSTTTTQMSEVEILGVSAREQG